MASLAMVATLAACGANKGRGSAKSTSKSAAVPEDCSEIPVPGDPMLAGLSIDQREAIQKRAEKGVLVVQYEPDGCEVRLRVLDDCRAGAGYAYKAAGKRYQRVIEKVRVLMEELPLAIESLGGPLEKKGAVRLDQVRVGRLEAAKRTARTAAELDGKECAGATHVAVAIDVGGAAITAGAPPELGSDDGFFDRDAGNGVELIERIGDPQACRSAAKRSEKTAGCDLPLRLNLVPLSSAPKAVARSKEGTAARAEVEEDGAMIAVPAGDFFMGNDLEKNEAPRHKVSLDGFGIDRYEVTAASYARCVASGACTPAKTGGLCTSGVPEKASHPINCVSWAQAAKYCEQAKLRLPTEAEWERAARGTDGRPFVWGNEWPPPGGVANLADKSAAQARPFWVVIPNYDDGQPETSPVGAYEAGKSPVGALDMAGNVMEWTADWYTDRPYTKGPAKNPKGPASGEARSVRGGSYGHHRPVHISVTARAGYRPDSVSEHIGFRCAK